MKLLTVITLLLLSFSCTSASQGRGDSTFCANDTLPDTTAVQRITLLFAGDLMQHKEQLNKALQADGTYNYADCFEPIKEAISQADFAIGNLEVTLGGKPYTGYPTFSAPDAYAAALQAAGFDVLLTANNHCLDRRKRGLERTIRQLDSLQIRHLGTYIDKEQRDLHHPLLLEKNGFRIALLNYTYGTNGIPLTAPNIVNYIDKTLIAEDIKAAQAMQPDAIIACMHWGIEYQSLPSREQQAMANWLLQQGVTHVIGSHPHVVQPMELRTDSLTKQQHVVVYSLGNFISNMSARKTDGGVLFKLELTKDSTMRVSHCEYQLVWTARPALTRTKNFVLYPVDAAPDSLPAAALNWLKIFTNDTRKLFSKHNVGIEENTFFKKKSPNYLQNKR